MTRPAWRFDQEVAWLRTRKLMMVVNAEVVMREKCQWMQEGIRKKLAKDEMLGWVRE